MHAKRNFHPWRALAPVPYDGREFCTLLCALLAVAAHTELWRFANHTVVSCLSSLRSHLSVCSLPQASLFASLSLVCLHHLQLLPPSCTQCTYASSAMYCSPVLFHPPSQAQDRSSGRTGNSCSFCAPQRFSSRNAFSCSPSEQCSHPLTTAGNSRCSTASSHSSLPTLFRMAWKYESTAFPFVMPSTIRSLLGVFDACTASHLSCIALFCAAANGIN